MLTNVQKLKAGGMRYSNMRIEEIPSEKFPSMVQITKGPSRLKSIVGKKFISLEKAVLAIDEASAVSMIEKERTTVKMEMLANGIVSISIIEL
jgi:hypothetical protein